MNPNPSESSAVPSAEPVPKPGAVPDAQRAAFFRQSGWLMVAGIGSGVMMWAVHFLSKLIPEEEYGTLVALLAATILVPVMPLQMVFAQQTASDLALGRLRQLAGKIRLAWAVTTALWVLAALIVCFTQDFIMARWNVAHRGALWSAMAVILLSLWLPMFLGMLQGQQNFLWYGWVTILNGAGRITAAALIVIAFQGQAAGIVLGGAIGLALAISAGVWQTRTLWTGASEPFDRRGLLRQVVPLVCGFGAMQFLFSADTVFVKAWFPDQTAFYGAAGTLSRALIWLVGPLAAVMFPKIVQSTARAEKTNLLSVTLLSTGVLAALAAGGLWLLGPWVVKLVYKPVYVSPTVAILPWYAGAMVPLSLLSVLINNLLARGDYRVVPWMVLTAITYAVALTQFHASLVNVLQTLAAFCTLGFLVCAWFTYHQPKTSRS